MDEIVDRFFLKIPVWVLGRGRGKDRLNELLDGDNADGVRTTPVFTDKDLAQRFLTQHHIAGFSPTPIADGNILVGFLRAIEKRKITHVSLDASKGKIGKTIPVADFRVALERAIDTGDGSG